MSKRINNYKGRHHGWKQNRVMVETKKKGVTQVFMMWMNYVVKSRAFMKARGDLRAMLAVKGKKALKGAKRQKVLDQYFAVRY